MSTHISKLALLACAVLLTGCETMQSKTAQGALAGSAIGAGAGAILGNQEGHHAGTGAAIGAGLGALSGALIGHAMEDKPATQYPTTTTTTTSNDKGMFCPVGGEHYSSSIKYCPIHGVELKPVQ